ncbi:MAG: hypothetical protein ABJA78_02400 [Ferruginibacter sp.]
MKKEDVPQDISALGKITTELCYATDKEGKYITEQSRGWDVKITALDVTWENVAARVAEASRKILNREASPLLFFMEKNVMDISILAGYTGFWKWQVKRHLTFAGFNKLSESKLLKYAEIFNVTVDELKNPEVHAC